jgi:hypothetical protein
VALIDGLTNRKHPCEVTDKELARVMMLTRARTDVMLDRLESDGFVLKLWRDSNIVSRVVRPDLSSKPATARKWIKEYCCAYCADDAEADAFARPPLPLALPS